MTTRFLILYSIQFCGVSRDKNIPNLVKKELIYEESNTFGNQFEGRKTFATKTEKKKVQTFKRKYVTIRVTKDRWEK